MNDKPVFEFQHKLKEKFCKNCHNSQEYVTFGKINGKNISFCRLCGEDV